MAGRACSWRQKPPEGFADQLAAVSSVRMFLLQEIGPTSFVIKEASPERSESDAVTAPPLRETLDDEAVALAAGYPATAAAAADARALAAAAPVRRRRAGEDKFKVQIGYEMKCSCKAKGGIPCKHLLFVLLKLLRVPPENPFLWQGSLLDHEIDQVLRGRYQAASSKRNKAQSAEAGKEGVLVKPVEPGDVCAICQEDLCDDEGEIVTDNGPMVYCKQSCGNSVHAKCMKVWAEHKASVGDKITCPFCREDWGPGAVETIKKEIRQSRRPPNVHYGVTCNSCKSGPITGNRFRCLVCADLDLCERCFCRTQAHKDQGHPFVSRPTIDSNWETATRPPPVTGTRRTRAATDEQVVPAELVNELQTRELGVEDYELLLQLDARQGPVPLHQHLATALAMPSVAEVTAACARGDGLCGLCSTPIRISGGVRELRKAPCGTVLHLSCVQAHIAGDSNLLCPCCSDPLFNGLRPPGRAPARALNPSSQSRVGPAAGSTAGHGQQVLQVGGDALQTAPRLRSMRDRSPATRTLLAGALTEAHLAGGMGFGMSVTGRQVGAEETSGPSEDVAFAPTTTRRQMLHPGPAAASISGGGSSATSWGSRGGAHTGMTAMGVGVGAGVDGLTSGDRIRAEPASLVNARLQRARREARSSSLDPGERSVGSRGGGPISLQVSARNLSASGIALSVSRGSDGGSGVGVVDEHIVAPLANPARVAPASSTAAAVADAVTAPSSGVMSEGEGTDVSRAARQGNSQGTLQGDTLRVASDVPHASLRGVERSTGVGGGLNPPPSRRPPRAGGVHSAGASEQGSHGHQRGGLSREWARDDARALDVSSISVGNVAGPVGYLGRGGVRVVSSRSLTARTAGGGAAGTTSMTSTSRRCRSTGAIAVAVAVAAPATLGHTIDGLGVGVGEAFSIGESGVLLPDLVSPGARAGSEPTGQGRRTGESTRTHEVRETRDRDHLDCVRDRKREKDRERARERQRERGLEEMQSIVLGGCGLGAGTVAVGHGTAVTGGLIGSGKVGRHVIVGRRHVGGGQLRPLNQRVAPDDSQNVGLYDTTLS